MFKNPLIDREVNPTAMARTPFIVGNWKMNLNRLEAIGVVQKLAFALPKEYYDRANVVVIPPFTGLRSVQTPAEGDKLSVTYDAQDVSVHESGVYTGEISASMLGELGCAWVVIGHSERRNMHAEDDELVAKKAETALREGMNPIVCVGEPLEVREAEEHVEYAVSQVKGSLANLTNAELVKIVITYEPVWAIGTGKVVSAADAQEVCAAIRETIAKIADESIAKEMRIFYGGSVKIENVAEIVNRPDVDGGLVGDASLDGEALAELCTLATDVAQNA